MAKPEHFELLEQGVMIWNQWRIDNPDVRPDLKYAKLSGKQLAKANLDGVDLSGADLVNANLRSAGFKGACLQGANFGYANLSNTNLIGADLSYAHLTDANLSYAFPSKANLGEADLRYAHLIGADFYHSTLIKANLVGADFSDAHLVNTDFSRVKIGCTTFGNNDLSSAKGLDSIDHIGPSAIGVDTIYRSQGKIPAAFLRGCGVPEAFITYMRSLTMQPIQFSTCFISFTEADDTFSERLYNDLQAKGVRCWRWKEDAKWGKTLMRSIDEAVRVYDKLIVICSEQSLNAPAVIREIERALQKEDEQARQGNEGEVLFPIRLDDYIFTGWQHHRKADVTAKTVGDFRQWKGHDSYQKAFDRLLRDLKTEA